MEYYTTIKELIDFTCVKYASRDGFIFKKGNEYERKLYGEFKVDCY